MQLQKMDSKNCLLTIPTNYKGDSKMNYFHRVQKLTPTKFWINNPTREEADWALKECAIQTEECEEFGPVIKFRDSFIKHWNYTLGTIQEIRKE